MKKSIFAGFLGTLALGGKFSYKSEYTGGSDVQVKTAGFPTTYDVNTHSQSAESRTSQAIINANFATGDNTAQSIDSLFLTLPSIAQLDRLILGADSVAILKTIQVVATDDSLGCNQRISYLLQVLGRVRAAVEKKQFAADQLKIIIDGANKQIDRLKGEIKILNENIQALWLDELNDNLAKAVSELEFLYRQFNAIEANIAPNQAKVAGYQKDISLLIASSDAARNSIANDRLRLTEVEATVRNLQNRLLDAKNAQKALQSSIFKSQTIIERNTKRINQIRQVIRDLENEIRRFRNQIDRVRAKYNDLQIKVERLRTDINVAQRKAENYRAEIRSLQDRIAIERRKLRGDDLDDLNQMIAILKKAIPNIQQQIDRHYYYCYGEGAVDVVRTGGVVVYIVKGERFGDYLRNQYGAGTVTSSLRQLGSVQLRRVDIFGQVWAARYGYPFSDAALEGTNDLSIRGTFSCVSDSSEVKGHGSIYEIGSDYLGIKTHQGINQKLYLGSCSRVQSVSQLPTIGQHIAYTAVPSAAQGYGLVQATCY